MIKSDLPKTKDDIQRPGLRSSGACRKRNRPADLEPKYELLAHTSKISPVPPNVRVWISKIAGNFIIHSLSQKLQPSYRSYGCEHFG